MEMAHQNKFPGKYLNFFRENAAKMVPQDLQARKEKKAPQVLTVSPADQAPKAFSVTLVSMDDQDFKATKDQKDRLELRLDYQDLLGSKVLTVLQARKVGLGLTADQVQLLDVALQVYRVLLARMEYLVLRDLASKEIVVQMVSFKIIVAMVTVPKSNEDRVKMSHYFVLCGTFRSLVLF